MTEGYALNVRPIPAGGRRAGGTGWRRGLIGPALLLVGLALLAAPAGAQAPLKVRAVAVSVGEVELAWSPVDGAPAATSYRISRDGKAVATVDGATRRYVDSGAPPSAKLIYTVEALGPDGRVLAPSDPAKAKTPDPPETPDTTPPSEPEELTVVEGPGYVLLDWYAATDDSDITGYRIYRDGQALATVDSGTLQYVDDTASADVTHAYEVETLDAVGNRSDKSKTKKEAKAKTKSMAQVDGSGEVSG
jgi:hypothetical protein